MFIWVPQIDISLDLTIQKNRPSALKRSEARQQGANSARNRTMNDVLMRQLTKSWSRICVESAKCTSLEADFRRPSSLQVNVYPRKAMVYM
jgi:hypothetical protein